MKVSILAENLKKGLSIAMRGVSSRVQLPILSSILLRAGKEGLVLSATDLELSFQVKVRAKVVVEGELAVPAKLLSDLVATLPVGVVELSVEKQALKISSDKVKAKVVGQGSEEFPILPVGKGKGLEISVEELIEKAERVGIAAAKDDARPILAGVLWMMSKKKLTLVATDGYRLGVDVIEKGVSGVIEEGEKFVLPVRALMELTRVLEPSMKTVMVEFDKDKQQVVFDAEDLQMSSRLIAGEFPPYNKVIPIEKKITVILDKEGLIEAVKRASLFARDSANVVKLLVNESGVEVTAQSDQVGGSQSNLEAEVEGEEVKIAFNARYLLEYLGAVKGEKVTMETEGELKPAVFRIAGSEFLHVIMPVRTQN